MAATFFGEVVKAPCRAGTEEEEEEEEQSRRDTPEDREVRRQLARKRSGSRKAASVRRCRPAGCPAFTLGRRQPSDARPPPCTLGHAACRPYFFQNYFQTQKSGHASPFLGQGFTTFISSPTTPTSFRLGLPTRLPKHAVSIICTLEQTHT
jgi:hypothetical protein